MKTIFFVFLTVSLCFGGRFLEFENSEVPKGFIVTPYGYMLEECVHTIPEGYIAEESADGSIIATNPDTKSAYTIPRNQNCIDNDPRKLLT